MSQKPAFILYVLVLGVVASTNIRTNMENALILLPLPRKSYNLFGEVVLALFALIGVVLIKIAYDFDAESSLQCNPNESLASNLATRKYIETQCFLKYAQEFLPSLPLHVLIMASFGLVLVLSVIYAFLVKRRVEIFTNSPSTTTNGGGEGSQPLSGMTPGYTSGPPRYC